MRFLVDAQLPPALARWLVAAGHEAEHVGDVGLGDAQDQAIWVYAVGVGAVIVSKDEDFAQRKVMKNAGPQANPQEPSASREPALEPLSGIRRPNTATARIAGLVRGPTCDYRPRIIGALERGDRRQLGVSGRLG